MQLVLVWLALLSILTARVQGQTKVVNLGYAEYEGSLNAQTGNFEFLGMRYAAPPTGTRRWRKPKLPEPTEGVQAANAFPNRCYGATQGNQPTAPFPLDSELKDTSPVNNTREVHQKRAIPMFSEDCLFLNVITPAATKKRLPVVVWIHGGGYVEGSASGFTGTDIFDGNDLISEAGGGVVAVIIQYRLGVFGFLAGQSVQDRGVPNAGLYDQQFALRWVQEHISKFNGHPDKVTIWGQSAGAGSVLQHIVANGGNTQPPLFRAAITSSTFLPSQYKFNDRIPEQLYSAVVGATGCSLARDTLRCLRRVDVNLLQAANMNICNSGFFGTFVFVPVVDGRLITNRPTELLRKGKVNGDIVLAFTNTFEGALFVDMRTASTVQIPQYVANLFPEFRSTDVAGAVAQYAQVGTPIDQAIAIMGESIIICPTYFLLRAFGGNGFKGEYAVPPGGHGVDVSYYFPHNSNPIFDNTLFINNFAQSFLNFVLALDPNVKWDLLNTVPRWKRWDPEGNQEMLFNRTKAGVPAFRAITTAQDLLDRCDFWESVGAFSAQ